MKTLRVIPAVLIVAVILGSVGCKNHSYTEIVKDEFEITESTIEIIPEETGVTTVDDTVNDADITDSSSSKTDVTVTPLPVQSDATVVIIDTTSAATEIAVETSILSETTIQTEAPISTVTPTPTSIPTPEPTATPIPTDPPTPTPTISPVYDPQYTTCIADVGWSGGDGNIYSGVVYGVPCVRNSAGVWCTTTEAEEAVFDAAEAAGADSYSDWIIDGSQRDFS